METVEKKRLLKNVTITHVSYVKMGANKKQFFHAKSMCDKAEIQFDVNFFSKSDDLEKRLLYGVVYEPDVEDAHGDAMTADEIEKTAHEFLEYYRNIDTEHNLLSGAGTVVESYVTPAEMKIGKNVIKAGSWILVTRATEDIWESWKAGDITGYSMFGISRETQMSKGETKLKKFIQKLLNSVGLAKAFDATMEATIDQISRDPLFIMDIMQKEYFQNIDWEGTQENDLQSLALAMREAADYIDGKISVAKSGNDGTDSSEPAEPAEPATSVVDEPEPAKDEEPEPEPEAAKEPEAEPAVPATPETAEPAAEAEPLQKSAQDIVNDMFEKLSKSSIESIQQAVKPITDEFNSLRQTIKSMEEKIQTLETSSSLVQAPPKTEVSKSRSPGIGLLS